MPTNQYGVTEFDADPETAAELIRLKRQQQIADAMMARGQQPIQGQMVGNTYVAPSITQGLAQLFNAYAGRKGADAAEQGYKDLASKRRAIEDAAIEQYKRGVIGTPEQPMGPPTPSGEMGVKPAFAPSPEQRTQTIVDAVAGNNPRLARMAQMQFQMDTKKEDRAASREDKLFQLEMQHQNNLAAIKEKALEGRITREEADRRGAESKEHMARLVHSLKLSPGLTGNIEKPMTAAQKQKFEKGIGDDFKSTGQVMQSMAQINQAIADVSGSEGLSAREGYTGFIPAWAQGQKAMTAQNRIDTLKGKVTQMGKAMASMSGAIGPMAVQEWKIVSDAVNALDPRAGNFKEQLANVQAQAEGASARIKDWYDRRYTDSFEAYPQFKTESIPLYATGGGQAPQGTVNQKPTGGLSAQEQAELEQLRARFKK